MDDSSLKVAMLELDSGVCPVWEWLKSVPDKATRARLMRTIDRMSTGNFGDHKDLGGGVNERRVDLGPGYRIYFGREGTTVVVLIGAGVKKSQQSDIEQARSRWQQYVSTDPPTRRTRVWPK